MPPKPKRAPKAKKVETVNSDSDSEFGIPKKTAAPKGRSHPWALWSTGLTVIVRTTLSYEYIDHWYVISLPCDKYSVLTSWQTNVWTFYLTFTVANAFISCTAHTPSSILLDATRFLLSQLFPK